MAEKRPRDRKVNDRDIQDMHDLKRLGLTSGEIGILFGLGSRSIQRIIASGKDNYIRVDPHAYFDPWG